MNAIGLDLNAVGNHEFDRGAPELAAHRQRRLPLRTVGDERELCIARRAYTGARFPVHRVEHR